MLTPRSLSGMMRDRSLLLLFGLAAAAALFLLVANPGQAFAELSPTHSQNAAANTAADQSTTSPRVFSRSIGDSVAVASTFDNLGARVPRVFNVGISDGLNIATSPTPPPPSSAATSTTSPRPSTGLQGAGRAEEKLGPRNPAESKGDLTNNKDQKNGSVQEQPQSSISQELESVLSTLMQDLLGSDDSEPDDSNSSPQSIPVQVPPTIYIDSLYGAYAIAVIAISVGKSPRVVSMRRRIVGLYAVKSEDESRDAEMPMYARVTIIVVVIVTAVAMASAAGPVVGEAFADQAAGIAYKKGTTGGVGYRQWDPATASWSSEVAMTTGVVSDIYAVKFLYSPVSQLKVIGVIESNGEIDIYYCEFACTTASNWTGPTLVADVTTTTITAGFKYFDMAFESTSGDLLIVYDKVTTTDTNDFFYKTFNPASGLSGESGFNYNTGDGTSDNDIRYFKMASKPGSDEIAMILLDATAQDAIAFRWTGSGFTSQQTISSALGTTSITGEAIGIAYETSSGNILAVSGNGANSMTYGRYTGTWTTGTLNPNTSTTFEDVKWVSLKPDPSASSNRIMICDIDDQSDWNCAATNGSTIPASLTQLESNTATSTRRPADFAWDATGSTGLTLYYESGSADLKRRTYTSGAFNAESAAISVTNAIRWVAAATDDDTNANAVDSLWAIYGDATNDAIGDAEWDGSAFTLNGETTITNNAGGTNTIEAFGLDFRHSPGSRSISQTITVSDSITAAKSKLRTISETITISPAIIKQVTHPLPNTLTVVDSIARSVTVTPDSNVAGMAYRSDDGTNGSSSPKYREWNPTTKTWSSQVELESAGSPIRNAWIEFSPVSTKRVIIVLSDDGTLDSYVCDFGCTTPGNWAVTHDIVDLWNAVTPAIQKRPFDIEFEKTSGDLMLVYDKEDGGDSTTDLFYRIMPDSSTTFGSENAIDDTGSGAPDNVYSFVRLDSRKTSGSNDLGLVAASETNHRAVAWYFNGATQTFGNINTLTTSTSTDINYEGVGVAFETSTGDLVAVAADGADVVYSQFSGGSWSSISTVGSMDLDTVKWVRLVPNPNAGRMDMQLVASGPHGSFNGLSSAYWSGSAWTVYDSDGAPVGSDDNLHAGTTASNSIDSTETRVFDFAWNNADDSLRGILVWGKSNQLSFKRFAATSSWTSALTITDDGSTHPWVSLNEHTNPTSADAVSVLGAAIDSDADISQLRWDGGTTAVFAWTDDGASTVGNTSPESFHVDFRRSPVLKKFPSITLTVADALAAKMRAKVFPESVTIVVSVVAEKGSPLDSARSAAVYRSGTGSATFNSPKYREWDPATQTWSAEVELPNTGSAIRDAIIRFSSDSSLRVVVSHSSDGTLNLFTCDNNCASASSWTLVAADFADTGSPDPSKPYRPYDMLFETTGERLVIVYDKELTENADFYYRTFDGTTLSAETGVNLAGGSADAEELRYLHLAAHSTTNEMTLAVLDATNLKTYGAVWNGSAWGNVQTVSSSLSLENIDGDSVDVAYEAQSGASLVLSGNGQNSAAYARWTGSSWTTGATNPNPGVTTEDVKFVSLKSDPLSSSNKIMACQSDDGSALSCSQFNAGTPGTWTVVTGNTGTTAGRAFDFAYNPAGTTGLLVSSSGASGTLDYRAFNGTAFGTAATLSAAGTHKWVLGASAISTTDVVNSMFLKSNSNFDTGAIKSKAGKTTLVGDASLTSESGNDTYESMHIDFQKSKKVKRTSADTITIVPSVARGIGKSLSDTVTIAPAVSKGVRKPLSDTINISAVAAKNPKVAIPIAISVSDSVRKKVTRSLPSTITIQDSITTITIVRPSVTLSIADSVAGHKGAARSVSDTATIGVSVSWMYHASRSASDTLSVSAAVSTTLHPTRSVSVTLSVADAITKSTTKSLSDAVTVLPSVSRTYSPSRSMSDAVTVSPAVAKVYLASRSAAEVVSVSDAVAGTSAFARAIADSVSLADAAARQSVAARSAADAITVSDAISSRTLLASRSLSDTLPASDSINKSISRSVSDAVSIADVIIKSATRSLSETLSATDAISPTATRPLSSTITITDAISHSVSRSLSDSVAVADSIAKRASRSLSDTLSAADSVSRRASTSAAETVSIADAIATTARRSLADSVTMTDSTSYVASRSLSDSISTTDAVSITVSRSLSDSVSITPAINSTTSRSMSDSVPITDAITTAVSRSLSDSVALADSVSTSVSRSIADTVSVTDAIARAAADSRSTSDSINVTDALATTTSRSLADSIAITDAITGKTSRSTSDTLSATDAISTSVSHSLSDAVSMTDSVTSAASRTMQETLSVTDTAATNAPRSPSDLMTVEDAIATSTSRSLSDAVGVTDAASSSTSVLASVSDSLAVADSISTNNINRVAVSDSVAAADSVTGALAASRLVADALVIEDATGAPTSFAREISDSLVIADGVSGGSSISVPVSDSLALSDAIARTGSGPFSDAVAVADSVSIGISRFLADAMPMADSVALPIPRTINDALVLADQVSAKAGTAVSVVDSLGVNSQITDVSVHWNRVFEEGVDLADCTPFSCNQSLHFDEGLNLADGDFFTSPPGRILPTTLAVTDSIAVNRPQTFITLGDSAAVSVAIKPLLPILVNDHADNHGRPPNLSVPGTYTWDGTPADLRDAIELDPLYFNTTVIRDDLPNQIITLRLRDVTIVPTADLPANNTLISDRAANIPAGVPVQVRVNFMDTPALSGHSGFIQSLDVQFTPAMLTTDFGLIVTPMDVPPAGATLPPEELRPLYIDVRWWGNVPGGSDPSVQSYYQHPPTFTFTVTDDWARSESAARDANGVPLIKIRLLNEGTNQWEEVNTVQNLSAGNGTYTFTATLPHFSDYVITAVKSATAGSGTGTSSSHVPPPPVVPKTFAVNLADSLTLATSTSNKAVAVIEEFVNEKFSARLLDSVKISSRPVAYNTFTILKDVDVSITVVDVKQKDVAPPSATAVLQTDITNAGDQAEKFTLNFWYNDQTGKRAFDLSQQVEVEAHGSKTLQVTIPFTEPGTYRVTAEARSVPENDLLESTQLTVVVPWLSVYLYVLMTVAIAILGGSAIAIALYMARNGMMITAAGAGTAGALILLLGRKRKPRVRVAERKLADNDDDDDDNYDLLVNVKLANGSEGRLAPGERMALFDFEIINRSRRKQEFVLAYHLVDMAGTTMPESAAEIKIGKRKIQLRKAKIELLAGAYVLHVEARTAKGEVLSSDRVSVRTA
ncbi:hypothetical protein NTE_01437 [Candidatus Nitrososphaera evergladensis SR1]|uniref:Uncharacterized protein n=1 Tax=Candidatus Nitrososphaera evergladensis SR1 TaxID=1459636 RepID=A0A075MPL2_9ARCH|nr:hypothetical protein [Candidatus Nitrososphaera evergladensis]AIF83501.1 hypothetical protein NTE_01437 [Candidatus Nitrososphaera evergladensis SR1]